MKWQITFITPLILSLLLLVSNHFFSQEHSQKNYYLIEGLNYDQLSEVDKEIIDTSLIKYYNATNDTDRIKALNVIVEESWDDNVWPKYNMWVYQLITKLMKKKHSKKTQKFLLRNYAGTLNNIGFHYKNQGDIENALKYYEKAIKIKRKIKDPKGVAVGLNNIAVLLDDLGETEKALEYYLTCLKIQKEINDSVGIGRSYSNIGLVYYNKLDLNKAIKYSFKSRNIQQKIGDKKGLSISLNNLAAIYSKQGNTDRSIELYKKTIELYHEIGDRQGVAWSANNIAKNYLQLKNIKKSLDYAQKSMEIARELQIPQLIRNAAQTLSEIYQEKNQGIKALEMYKIYVDMKDSINNVETQKAATRQQMKFEYEKQKAIDDAERDKVIALKQEETVRQQVISIAIACGLIIVIIFLIFVFNRLKHIRKQKALIEIQNKEITDSITYAKRIQEAILPTDDFINSHLPEHFVFYKPKDIVAGDFYWAESLPLTHSEGGGTPFLSGRGGEKEIFFAAADCTGHGVPGAMLSVVCNNALDSCVKEYGINEPGKILDQIREIIVLQMNKSKKNPNHIYIRDGMDIALCSLQLSESSKLSESYATLQYAGANNPLWIIRPIVIASETKQSVQNERIASLPTATRNDDNFELIEIKGTKQPIGKVDNPQPFTTHTLELQKGDTVYVFTDGFADQFGGPKGKKFMYKPFKILLLSIQDKTMSEQKEILKNKFHDWKGSLEQVDDVCIIGVRI